MRKDVQFSKLFSLEIHLKPCSYCAFSRLTSKATELEGERTAKIKEWKNKIAPLQQWLKKEETKCAQYQTTPDNHEDLVIVMHKLQVNIYTALYFTTLSCIQP